jgi:hypothetical protein
MYRKRHNTLNVQSAALVELFGSTCTRTWKAASEFKKMQKGKLPTSYKTADFVQISFQLVFN